MPKKDLLQISLEHLKASQKERRRYQVNVLGKEFVVLPDVFSPKYFVDTEFFARHVPIKKDGSFLEIGNGTGVVSIFALLRGARIVVSTDINPQAVKNTKINAKLHGVEKKIVILEGDLFDPVNGMRFDQIFWNPPFMNMTKKDAKEISMLERAIFDIDNLTKVRFIQEAKRYLNPGGSLLIGYSSNYGNIKFLLKTLEENGYKTKEIKKTVKKFANGKINLEILESKI